MRRTNKKRRTRFVKRNQYAAPEGVIDVSTRRRFYPPLPRYMNVAVPFHFDTRMECAFDNTLAAQNSHTNVFYWFWDPINMSNNIGPVTTATNPTNLGTQTMYSLAFTNMISQYNEARFKTCVLDVEFSADFARVVQAGAGTSGPAAAIDTPNVQMVIGKIPSSYLRLDAANFHTPAQTGVVYRVGLGGAAYDYYSILSGQTGSKQLFLPVNGNQETRKTARIIVDSYEHTGGVLTATSTIAWPINQTRPTVAVTFPAPANRTYIVCAVRYRSISNAETTPKVFVRCSGKMTQHCTFTDNMPQMPYLDSTALV